MRKRIIVYLFVLSIFFIGSSISAQSDLSLNDRQQITSNLDSLIEAINAGDNEMISMLVSSDNKMLQLDMQERIRGGMPFQLDYSPFDKNVEIISSNEIKIKARFAASGFGWSVSGLSTYFTFEKQDDQWFIVDTNFYEKLGINYIFGFIKKILIFTIPIGMVILIFCIWMLIDCIKRDFDDKTLWIILILFLNFIAAILYFFIIKRKKITRKIL